MGSKLSIELTHQTCQQNQKCYKIKSVNNYNQNFTMNFLYNFYDIFVAIIVGAVEGFTEFLPISSTAHNQLVGNLLLGSKSLGLEVSNIFSFGALIAIIQYFWSDLREYLLRVRSILVHKESRREFIANANKWRKGNAEKTFIPEDSTLLENQEYVAKMNLTKKNFENDIMIIQLILATIPAALIGLAMHGTVKELGKLNIWIGFFLIIGSMLMGIADWYYAKSKHREIDFLSKLQVFNIGLFQTLGIFPGISRSGATVSGTFFLGIERAKAVRFAFLLGIPILLLAGLKDGFAVISSVSKSSGYPIFNNPNVLTEGNINFGKISMVGIVAGALVAYFVALASLKWLLKYLGTHRFTPFIVYRVLLGLALILASLAGYK
jgi:undecaprenyl-diphosphatase